MSAIGRLSAGAAAALILTLGVSLPARAATIAVTNFGDGTDRATLDLPNGRTASLTRRRF